MVMGDHDQQGFTTPEVILVAFIILFIGCVGWYVRGAMHKASDKPASATQTPASTSSDTKRLLPPGETTKEGDYLVYTNRTLGLTFKYPVEFNQGSGLPDNVLGKIQLTQQNSLAKPTSGVAYEFTGLQGKTDGGVVTKDYKPGNPADIAYGFTKYDSCQGTQYESKDTHVGLTTTLYEINDDVCVKAIGVKNTSSDPIYHYDYATVILQKNFKHNDQFAGVQMTFYQVSLKPYTQAELQNNFNADNSKDIIDIAKSMQEL
jgi:hypothetical protein